jgi:hypothetical protein
MRQLQLIRTGTLCSPSYLGLQPVRVGWGESCSFIPNMGLRSRWRK